MKELKQVRICLGRFQPFTLGHLKMATYKCKGPETIQGFKGPINQKEILREQPDINEINKQKTLILVIKVNDNEVDKRHPFPFTLMKEEMDLVKKYPEIEDVMFVDSADICKWGEMIKHAGYQASVWITGSDEAKPYVEMASKVPEYEEHNRDNRDCKDAYTKSFYVESVERNDNSNDFTETISGTKVRQSIIDDDKDLFTKMMPKGCDNLFDKFKEALSNPNIPEKYTKPKKKKIKEYLNTNMKSIITFIKEAYNPDLRAPEIVTKHLGLKYNDGSGHDTDGPYTAGGSKLYIERGHLDGLNNVFVIHGFYRQLDEKDASLIVCTTSRANSKTMKIAAVYGLDQKYLEEQYEDMNKFSNPKDLDTSKFGEVICVHCADIDDMVENIRNDWGIGSKSYMRKDWELEEDYKGKLMHWESGVKGLKINNVIQTKEAYKNNK